MFQAVKKVLPLAAIISLFGFGLPHAMKAEPLKASFSYQGYLKQSGNPAAGVFDLQFEVYDSATGGSQLGASVIHEDVTVSQGLFSVELDFGNDILVGKALWIAVGVRDGAGSGTGGFTPLLPRQPLHQFSLNGKEANLSVPLTGLVTKTAFNSTIIGSGTAFTQELSESDAILIGEEVFTVTSIQDDTLLEVDPPPESSVLNIVGFRDDTFLRVRAGDGQDKLLVKRSGVVIGDQGTPISRIEHGTIGNCAAPLSTGVSGSVNFSTPFQSPPRILATPFVTFLGCTEIRITGLTETGFSWLGTVWSSLAACNCIFWLAIGT